MKRMTTITFAALLLFCSVHLSGAASLSGRVTAQDGRTVAMARLTALTFAGGNSDSVIFQTSTDAAGAYAFLDLPSGNYHVRCEHDDYLFASRTIFLTDSSHVSDFDFVLTPRNDLPRNNSISGFVFDSQTNTDIDFATIYLWQKNGNNETIFSFQSDTSGQYELRSFYPLGPYVLLAEAPGYRPWQSPDTLRFTDSTQIELNIFLDALNAGDRATLTGHVWVTDPDSMNTIPIAGAEIRLYLSRAIGDSSQFVATTDAQGEYNIEDIPPGIGRVIAAANGFLEKVHELVLLPPEGTMLDFSLNRTNLPGFSGTISGTVLFERTGLPVVDASIQVHNVGGPFNFSSTTNTTEAGKYSVRVPTGDFAVICRLTDAISGFLYQEYYDDVFSLGDATVVAVAENQNVSGIDFGIPAFSVPEHVMLSGTVRTEAGVPLENATVTAWSFEQGDSLNFVTTSDAHGEYAFRLSGLNEARSFILFARKNGYALEFYNNQPALYLADRIYAFSDTAIAGLDFSLAPEDSVGSHRAIAGFVTNDAGTPLSGAFVVGAGLGRGDIIFTFTDAHGEFEFQNLGPLPYYLLFAADGHVPEFFENVQIWEQATPVFPTPIPPPRIHAALTPIAPALGNRDLAGMVVDQAKQPLSGVLITVKDAMGRVLGYGFTDSKGAYEIGGLTGGRYTVQATRVAFRSETQEILHDEFNMMVANFTLAQTSTGVHDSKAQPFLPAQLELSANYPNPFNPSTTISFSVPREQNVRLLIYNLLGHKIKELLRGHISAGQHSVKWEGRDEAGHAVGSGIYLCVLEIGQERLVRKMVLSK